MVFTGYFIHIGIGNVFCQRIRCGKIGGAKASVTCSLCDNDRERRVGQGKTPAPLMAGIIYSALSLDSPMLSCPDLYFTGEGRRH